VKKLSRLAALAVMASAVLAGHLFADPTQEITRAAVVSAGSVNSDNFLVGFSSVLARVKSRQLADYVRAAIAVRPDLQNDILVTALNVRSSSNPRLRQSELTAIVRAAVRAANGGVTNMVMAAIEAHPDQRNVIALAASSATPRQEVAMDMLSLHAGHSNDTASGFDNSEGRRHRKHHGNDDDDDEVSPEKPPHDI
jgi:hypothetical protein